MFIAINAKADISDSKKGKLTPAQNAQLNAWCLATKTGILDCLDRCEATSSSYSAVNNEATIVFHKGYVVICGRLIECEEGSSLTVTTPLTDSETGWIILRYDLSSSGENEFKIVQKKTTDGALIQQDLNDNPLTAVFEFPLYSYTATPNTISLSRNVEYVPDIGGKLDQFEESLTAEGKPLGGYDQTQGTIEERLDNINSRLDDLGFKSGYLSGLKSTSPQIAISKQGRYAIISFQANTNYQTSSEFVRETTLSLPTIDGWQWKSKYDKSFTIFNPSIGSSGALMTMQFTTGSSAIRLYWGTQMSYFSTQAIDVGIELAPRGGH